MNTYRQFFTSFTIEGVEKHASGKLLEETQKLIHDWIVSKERSFGRTDSEFPRFTEFVNGGRWENPGSQKSYCATISDRQVFQTAWGLYYEHAFKPDSDEFVILEFVVQKTSSQTVAVAVTLSFKGDRFQRLSPPAFVSALLRLGDRTYNSKCCSKSSYNIIQKSISHARGMDTAPSVTYAELNRFLADTRRSETVVAVCKQDLDELDAERRKSEWKKIGKVAANLSGRALFFQLEGAFHKKCFFVIPPGKGFRDARQILFSGFDWNKLERDLANCNPPPGEEGVSESYAKLVEKVGKTISPVRPSRPVVPVRTPPPSTQPSPPAQIPSPVPAPSPVKPPPPVRTPLPDPPSPSQERTIRRNEAPPSVPFPALATATDNLRQALSALVSTLDGILGEKGGRQ